MKRINRLMTNICSDNLIQSRNFYTKLFDFQVDFDSDWFIHLISNDRNLEMGIIKRTHDIVPKIVQNEPQGFYLTFVVDDVDDLLSIVQKENFEIIEHPTDTFYGQRRMLLRDPDGTLVDISSLL